MPPNQQWRLMHCNGPVSFPQPVSHQLEQAYPDKNFNSNRIVSAEGLFFAGGLNTLLATVFILHIVLLSNKVNL